MNSERDYGCAPATISLFDSYSLNPSARWTLTNNFFQFIQP